MADEPLSIDAAIGLLDAGSKEPDETNAVEAQPEEIQAEGEPQPEVEPEPEEVIQEEEPEAEPEEVIPRPASWAAEDQAVWDGVPAEAKAVIMARETERDRTTQRAVQEASEARKTAEASVQDVTGIKAALEQVLPRAQQMLQGKWGGMTQARWVELARENPAQYTALKAEYDSEIATLNEMQATQQQAHQVAFQSFVQTEAAKLKDLAPDLADPKLGQARKQELATFLLGLGVPNEVIPTLDANTVALAYDGMRFRKAQSGLKQPAIRPVTARQVTPTAAAPVSSPQRATEAAKNRFAQTRSVEDAVAFLNSKG